MSKLKIGYFDLETLELINQQSDWKLKPCKTCGAITQESIGGVVIEGGEDNLHSIRMSIGVVKDTFKGHNYLYPESNGKELVKHLHSLDLIVGYNIRQFDYIILEKYGGTMLKHLPTFDMFAEVKELTGQMISLANLAKRTFNIEFPKLSGQAVTKWWEGKYQEVIDYCIEDVRMTQKLFNHGCRQGFLKYWNPDERKTEKILTTHWPEWARQIVYSRNEVKCPIK